MIACPTCKAATTVEETRGERRRRVCSACGRKVTTIEVVVENARRYDRIAVMPRKDLELMLRMTGKAMASLVGTDGVLALINDAGVSIEATPASDVVAEGASQLEDAAPAEPDPVSGARNHVENALTEEELRAIGVDPDNEEQLAALGLIVQGSD